MPPMVPVPQLKTSCPSFFAPSRRCARVCACAANGINTTPANRPILARFRSAIIARLQCPIFLREIPEGRPSPPEDLRKNGGILPSFGALVKFAARLHVVSRPAKAPDLLASKAEPGAASDHRSIAQADKPKLDRRLEQVVYTAFACSAPRNTSRLFIATPSATNFTSVLVMKKTRPKRSKRDKYLEPDK